MQFQSPVNGKEVYFFKSVHIILLILIKICLLKLCFAVHLLKLTYFSIIPNPIGKTMAKIFTRRVERAPSFKYIFQVLRLLKSVGRLLILLLLYLWLSFRYSIAHTLHCPARLLGHAVQKWPKKFFQNENRNL